jgi:predicted NBD/HSP70 family sugar kinase
MTAPKGGEATHRSTLPSHGSSNLPTVDVDTYNCELEDEDGFVGDKAGKGAFREILEGIRKKLRSSRDDPLGTKDSAEISKKKLDALLTGGDAEAAAVVQSAIEDFAQQLKAVIKKFLRLKAWRDTECIAVGGGFREGRVGELAVARAGILLKEDGQEVDLQPIHNNPDEAGLVGAAHLLPRWMVEGHEAILAVDIGGTNIRAGVVELNLGKAKDLSKARVLEMRRWRHLEEDVERDEVVGRISKMLAGLTRAAKKDRLDLAPVIGIGCPGLIADDGSITRGAHNLPGNWHSGRFNLARAITEQLPRIGDHETLVVLHNDAVVQGLSELPHLAGYKRWGVLTIGTGLGNARFSKKRKGTRKR